MTSIDASVDSGSSTELVVNSNCARSIEFEPSTCVLTTVCGSLAAAVVVLNAKLNDVEHLDVRVHVWPLASRPSGLRKACKRRRSVRVVVALADTM